MGRDEMMKMHAFYAREIAESGGSPSGTKQGVTGSSFRHPIIRQSSERFPLKQKGMGSDTTEHANVNLYSHNEPCY